MPTVTIPRGIAVQQAADALGRQLGSGYEVTARGSGTLAVQHGSLSSATVRVVRDGETTTFRVHGGGLIISRLVERARHRFASAIREALGPVPGLMPAAAGLRP